MTLSINVITNQNNAGLTHDTKIFVKHLRHFSQKEPCTIQCVPYYAYETQHVDINVFFEIPNPLLCHYAKINILVVNQEWFYTSWGEYLTWFDEIWVKSVYAKDLLEAYLEDLPISRSRWPSIRYTGWTSMDMWHEPSAHVEGETTHSSKQVLHLAGVSPYKNTDALIQLWKAEWPVLYVVYNQDKLKIQEKSQDNIRYIRERLSQASLQKLMSRSSIHICCSCVEGYGHYIHEGLSTKALVITSDFPPMNSSVDSKWCVRVEKTTDMPYNLGERVELDKSHWIDTIQAALQLSPEELVDIGETNRLRFIEENRAFRNDFMKTMAQLKNRLDQLNFCEKLPVSARHDAKTLPSVSIVTITRNRSRFFPLMLQNYLGCDYPAEKLEWVIIEETTDQEDGVIRDLVSSAIKEHDAVMEKLQMSHDDNDDNEDNDALHAATRRHTLLRKIQVTCLEKGDYTLGYKRNLSVKKANYDIIACMDDDDIYMPRGLLLRLAYMEHYKKSCSYCTTLACFDIDKVISSISVPPHYHPPAARVSEATLLFTRDFWKERPFDEDVECGEGGAFIQNRYTSCVELSWKEVIVSLLHAFNTSNRSSAGDQSNGCHFQFSDELFEWLTHLHKDTEPASTTDSS